jgi:hypothetical protein
MAEFDSFLTKAEQAMDQANQLYRDVGWTVVESHGDSTVSTKPTEISCDALKVEYYFDKNPLAVGRYIFDHYLELANMENEVFDFYREVQRYGPNAFTAHLRVKGQAVVSAREAPIFNCYLQLSETTCAIIGKSVEVPGVVYGEDAVKASIDYIMYLFEPVAGDSRKTHFIHVARFDPKGSIPGALANTRLRSRGSQIRHFVEVAASRI